MKHCRNAQLPLAEQHATREPVIMVCFYFLWKVTAMPTLESRITALEQQTPREIFTAHQLATCTGEELLDIFLAYPYSDGSHEKFVLSLGNSNEQATSTDTLSHRQ
jgi:hypothetical protein